MLRRPLRVGTALAFMFAASVAQATTVNFDENSIGGDSLQGSTGSITVDPTGTVGVYEVTLTLDTADFVGDATHDVVQSLGFKAFTSVTDVSLISTSYAGDLYWPSNVNNTNPNCDQDGSSAGFVCFDYVPDVSATSDLVITTRFSVTGTLDETLAWSFRGKYGTGPGWVISTSAPPIPEPTSAAVFGLGALIVGAALRRRLSS